MKMLVLLAWALPGFSRVVALMYDQVKVVSVTNDHYDRDTDGTGLDIDTTTLATKLTACILCRKNKNSDLHGTVARYSSPTRRPRCRQYFQAQCAISSSLPRNPLDATQVTRIKPTMPSSNLVALLTHNLQQPMLCMAFVLIYADKWRSLPWSRTTHVDDEQHGLGVQLISPSHCLQKCCLRERSSQLILTMPLIYTRVNTGTSMISIRLQGIPTPCSHLCFMAVVSLETANERLS
jgi:hypothetical protein